MPELPEWAAVARTYVLWSAERRFAVSRLASYRHKTAKARLTSPRFAEGKRILNVERHEKYLLLKLDRAS